MEERARLSGARTGEQTDGRTDGQQKLTRLGQKGFNFWDDLSGPVPGPATCPRIMVLQDLDSQALVDNQHAEM